MCLFCLIPYLSCITCLNSSSCLFNIDFELLNEMGKRRSLSNNDRNRALEMFQSCLSCRNVAGTFRVAPSTISRLFNSFNATNSVCGSTRFGYPRMTTQRQDNFIRNLSLRNRTLNVRTLTHELRIAAVVNIRDQKSVKALAGKMFNKRTQLYVINGNLNSQSYIDEILRPIAMPFLRRIWLRPIYQYDNNRSHRGRIVNDFVQQNNIVWMDWPANSPDLNPKEHI